MDDVQGFSMKFQNNWGKHGFTYAIFGMGAIVADPNAVCVN